MRSPSRRVSRPGHTVCPACGSDELPARTPAPEPFVNCTSCGDAFDAALVRTIEQIVVLPDAVGRHACECGHPEMRRFPDGTFHCPGCRSEVTPAG